MLSGVRFPGEPPQNSICAGVAELADALDLGSSANGMKVQVLSPAPFFNFLSDLLNKLRSAKTLKNQRFLCFMRGCNSMVEC
jgi:hypothetical protein